MAERLFPERQRCKGCSRALGADGAPVLLGLHCSPRCARVAAPVTAPANAPRECRTQRDGAWVFKRRYRSVSEIPDKIRQDPSSSWYWCGHCSHLHLGHTRMGAHEEFRGLGDLSDLGDLLVKLRGHATHKQVAAVAGVRPVRIKELEEGKPHPESLAVLFAVLKAYRCKLGVVLPKA